MNRTGLILVLLICLTVGGYGAETNSMKWGEPSSEEISLTEYGGACAVVLSDYGTLTFGPRTEYTRHIRIKILSGEGLKYSTMDIPFVSRNEHDVFAGLKAQTLNFENGRLIRTKARDIRTERVDSKTSKKVVVFPDVKPGSILECKYTVASLDFVKAEDWQFRHSVPCIRSEYVVNVPDDFHYLVTFKMDSDLSRAQQEDFSDALGWLYTRKNEFQYHRVIRTDDVIFTAKDKKTVYLLSGRTKRFVLRDQPPYQTDSDGRIIDSTNPTVAVHLFLCQGYFPFWYKHLLISADQDYDSWDRSQIRNRLSRSLNYVAYFLPTWQEMNEYWENSLRFGQRYSKEEGLLTEFVDSVSDSQPSIRDIFRKVQETVAWNGEYSMYASMNPRDLLLAHEGTSGDINHLLLNSLKNAGYQADPVLVKTTPGNPENIYPVRDQFNHIVVRTVDQNGDVMFLDASSRGGSHRYLTKEVSGAVGWMVKGYGQWVDVVNTGLPQGSYAFLF